MRIEVVPKKRLVALERQYTGTMLALDAEGGVWVLEERPIQGRVTLAWVRADHPFVVETPER